MRVIARGAGGMQFVYYHHRIGHAVTSHAAAEFAVGGVSNAVVGWIIGSGRVSPRAQ